VPGNGPETKFIEFKVPEGIPPTSTKAHHLVTISYFFKLDMGHFDVVVPVVIGTQKTPELYLCRHRNHRHNNGLS
jgi:hypothetical protein